MRKMFKKADVIVIAIVFFFSAVFYVMFGGSLFSSSERILQVFSEGDIYAQYNLDSLKENIVLTVKNNVGNMRISISNDDVYVLASDCGDKICEGKHIYKNGHSIACVPNKVLVCITSEETSKAASRVDSVAY